MVDNKTICEKCVHFDVCGLKGAFIRFTDRHKALSTDEEVAPNTANDSFTVEIKCKHFAVRHQIGVGYGCPTMREIGGPLEPDI